MPFSWRAGFGSAISFLIPLYIQIVQDRTPLFTSIAIVPYAITVAAAAILSVRLYDRLTPRLLALISFALVGAGMSLLAFTVGNDWSTPVVIFGLILVGLGEGTTLTLLFNVLVSASPKELAGDVGALRGVVNNVSSALGAAFAGVVAVGLLSLVITTAFAQSNLPPALEQEINFDRIDFVSNDQLKEVLSQTSVHAGAGGRSHRHQRRCASARTARHLPAVGGDLAAGVDPVDQTAELQAG
jgi:MFS family permease